MDQLPGGGGEGGGANGGEGGGDGAGGEHTLDFCWLTHSRIRHLPAPLPVESGDADPPRARRKKGVAPRRR